ncbi:MAG: DNA polymerase III subunit delta [Planctomycetaceae bacterium]|nr:DNA polymerase III subunit delta [Planctomycetaceae bacterium]
MHVTDYLWEPHAHPVKPVCVLFGEETYLKHLAFRQIRDQTLSQEDAEFSLSRFDGSSKDLKFPAILEEVSTSAMFGGGMRLIVIEDADKFVTNNREPLEKYCEKPSKTGILMLLVSTFPSNTKLYKKVDATGLLIDCSPLKEKDIFSWGVRWAKQQHKITVAKDAAEMLVTLVGTELGLLDQELAKLALIDSAQGKIDAKLVESSVGTWRTKTTYEMLDLALDGKTAEAIKQLDNLFLAGENPVGILAQISYTLRKLGLATQLILQTERLGKKIEVTRALEQVGVKGFVLTKTEKQLRQLGRFRGAKLNALLLQADMDLKGASRIDPKLILEKFLFVLADPRLKTVR